MTSASSALTHACPEAALRRVGADVSARLCMPVDLLERSLLLLLARLLAQFVEMFAEWRAGHPLQTAEAPRRARRTSPRARAPHHTRVTPQLRPRHDSLQPRPCHGPPAARRRRNRPPTRSAHACPYCYVHATLSLFPATPPASYTASKRRPKADRQHT